MGLVLGMQGVGVLIADVPAGILIERTGRKSSMLIGAAVVGLSTLAVGLAHTVLELLVYQLITGIGSALWTIARYTYLTDAVPIEERGRSLAMFGGVSRIGTFLGPAIGGFIGKHYGLSAPFFACAAIMGVNFLFCLLFIHETKRASVVGPRRLHLKQFIDILKTHHRALLTAGMGQICVQTLRAGRRIIIILYGRDVIGLDRQTVGLIFSLSSFIDMVMFPVAGIYYGSVWQEIRYRSLLFHLRHGNGDGAFDRQLRDSTDCRHCNGAWQWTRLRYNDDDRG